MWISSINLANRLSICMSIEVQTMTFSARALDREIVKAPNIKIVISIFVKKFFSYFFKVYIKF